MPHGPENSPRWTRGGTQSADAELLRRYLEAGAEDAFAELVRRHLDGVYSAALRRLGGDVQLAEDAAQQVFIALARKAGLVARHPFLSAWLYTTTRHEAANIVRRERRRKARERYAQAMNDIIGGNDEPAADWNRVAPVLDETIDQLGETERAAILLRFVERRGFAEVGAALRVSEDAARMRVDRALDKLRALLAKRGVTSTSSALAAALAGQAVAMAPAGLATSVAGAALSGAATVGAGSLAALWCFMSASKVTVSLAAAGTLAIATAVYQAGQARTAAAALAADRKENATAHVRLADLETQARTAELALADRERAAAQLAAASAAPKPAAAASTTEDAEARQEKALLQFLDNDPQVRRLRLESNRAAFKATYGPFLSSIGFTPEQIEQTAEARVQRAALRLAERAAGLDRPAFDENDPEFRAMFGDAADRVAQFVRNRTESRVVGELAAGIFYADEPISAPQAQRLTEILANAKSDTAPMTYYGARYDWERVLAEAEPILSAAQLQGLRALVGRVLMGAQYAAAYRESLGAGKK